MMTNEPILQRDDFKIRMQAAIRNQSPGVRLLKVARHGHVYTSGQRDATVYLIESGRIKLVLPTPEGKNCLLAIRTAGDIFGELCLSGNAVRPETAAAMQDVILRQVSCNSFLAGLRQESHLESLVQHLAARIAEQQEVIAMLTTENSEQRLAETLLHLGRTLGSNGSSAMCIGQRISQEELADMVGTTRSRIGAFLKRFRQLGLVSLSESRCLIICEDKLTNYIVRNTFGVRTNTNHLPKRGSGMPERLALASAHSGMPAAAA
jgi:CRP-like cAMP-binding protein